MLQRVRTALLLIGSLGLAVGVGAQEPIFSRGEGFNTPGVGLTLGLAALYPTFHEFTWGPVGFDTLTTCTLKVEKSEDGIAWTDLVSAQDCTVPGRIRAISGTTRFVRNSVTALSGGTVSIRYRAFDGQGCGPLYNGVISTVVGEDPSPGTELEVTVPLSERWKLLSIHFELIADSTVEDRDVFFTISNGGNRLFRTLADGFIEKDQRGIYTASALGFVGTAGLGPSSIHLPADVRTILIPIQSGAFLPGGYVISTETDGLQPGDDFTAATLLVERCPN